MVTRVDRARARPPLGVTLLTVPLAVEKVLFRLALTQQGVVPIARAFLELPLSLEEVEEYADKVADGHTVVKNEWEEFLSYEFPELMRQAPPIPPDDCPVCFGDPPSVPTEGGVEVRKAILCETCFRKVRRLNEAQPDPGVVGKLKHFFKGEEEVDLKRVAKTEHEIFYLGLRLGIEQFTHTSIASQSRMPSAALKERLDRMAARRYIHVGLLPSGDAVAYKFPPDLSYPKTHFRRFDENAVKGGKGLDIGVDPDDLVRPTSSPVIRPMAAPRPSPLARPVIRPKKPKLDIKIKGRRTRDS